VAEDARSLYEEALAAHARGDAEATHLVEAALTANDDEAFVPSLQHLRGRILVTNKGAQLRAHELLLTESAAAERTHPREAALMLADASFAALAGGEPAEAQRAAARGLALARRHAPDLEPALALAHGIARTFGDDAEAGRAEMLAAVHALGPGELLDSWEMLQRTSASLFWLEEYDAARTLTEALVEQARTTGMRGLLPVALDTLAAIDFRVGRWNAADARSTEALRVARELGQAANVGSILTTLAAIAAARGDDTACRAYAAEARALDDSYAFVEPWTRLALGILALSHGRTDEAIEQLEPFVAAPLDPAVVPWQRELVEAYVRVGRLEDARAIVDDVTSHVGSSDRAALRALVAHCRGLVEADFDEHFEQALRWHARSPTPFFRARTELAYGIRLRRARRQAEAKEHLNLALAVFERLGARAWAERAQHELASGRRAQRGPAPLREVLTPHELEVAILVGRGATNKEAAAALYVSPKTIDYHLASIYRKLELRSRTELAALIARER
jgi:DNA-binding CsgD family transcriptional regulator